MSKVQKRTKLNDGAVVEAARIFYTKTIQKHGHKISEPWDKLSDGRRDQIVNAARGYITEYLSAINSVKVNG